MSDQTRTDDQPAISATPSTPIHDRRGHLMSTDQSAAHDRALEIVDSAIYNVNPLAHDEETAAAEAVAAVDALLARRELLRELLNESKGEHAEGLAGEELPFLVRVQVGQTVRAIVDRWHAAGSPTDPEVLRTLAGAPDVTATEWGAKWSDGGYCPSSPPRSEEFARRHARDFGTRPIRRTVGPWLYDDTGEYVFAAEQDSWRGEALAHWAAIERVQAAERIRRFLDARPLQDDGTEQADISRVVGPGSPNTGWSLATSDVRDVLAERDGLAAEVRALHAELDQVRSELRGAYGTQEHVVHTIRRTTEQALGGDRARQTWPELLDALATAVAARTPQSADARERALSDLLRGMARRLGALRRDYNIHAIDPWENPDYCSKATPQSPCAPTVRGWDLCIGHVREEMERLRAVEARTLQPVDPDDPRVEEVARVLHRTSEMRLFTWERANASRRHGHWHEVMRQRARDVLAAADGSAARTPQPAELVQGVALKSTREALCAAQNALGERLRAGVDVHQVPHWIERLQVLCDAIDVHRPLGPDGKHGDRHTPTCGCEAVPQSAVPDGEDAPRLRAELAEVRSAVDEHPDVPHRELIAELRRLVENDDHCTETHRTPDGEDVPARLDAAENVPMRFIGWSVDRVDGSSSMGTFDRREVADEWCERLRGYGNDVHVVRAEVPDEDELVQRELDRLRAQRAAALALHSRDEYGACGACSSEDAGHTEVWPCPTARALGVDL